MKIGFIGAGQMARAFAAGIVESGVSTPADITISDPNPESVAAFQAAVGSVAVSDCNSDCAVGQEFLVLAVKPQMFDGAAASIVLKDSDTTVISVMGGVTIDTITNALSTSRVIRVMPNTPCLVGAGACGLAASPDVPEAQVESVTGLLRSMGVCVEVPEPMLDAVTGLSGSGPAYVFQFIQAMADGGVLTGLARPVALQLAAQTVFGAAKMVLESGDHPIVLSDRVASPGGTTIHGLQALAEGGMSAAVIDAVEAATFRSQELGGQ